MIVSTLAETLPGRNCPAGETSWRNAYHCCTSCRIWPEKLCLMFSTTLNLADLHLLSKKFHSINDCRYNYASLIFLWDVVWILDSVVLGRFRPKKSWFRWMEGHCWVSLLVNHLPTFLGRHQWESFGNGQGFWSGSLHQCQQGLAGILFQKRMYFPAPVDRVLVFYLQFREVQRSYMIYP